MIARLVASSLLIVASCAPTGRLTGEAPTEPTPPKPATPCVTRMIAGRPTHGYPLARTNGIPVTVVESASDLLTRKLADGEALWGFGQRFDALNMRGRKMSNWVEDAWGGGNRSYICAPFFISSEGYGVFVNNTGKVVVDCGATKPDELQIEVPDVGADVFVFTGTPREIVAEYTKLVGRPQPMPDWVFEPWISRNSYLSAYDVDRAIAGMERHGLKASAVVLEAWAQGLQNFRFEQSRYPNPKAWIEKLHGQGYRVVCWETPSTWDSTSTYREAKEKGFLVLKPDGSELRIDWLENALKIDFRKEAARVWWQKMHEPLVALGVAGFKTDGGERQPDPWFHNLHPYYYQRAVLDAYTALGKQGVTFARAATPSCVANATFWGGDQGCNWNHFPAVTRAGLSAALSGYFYWGHDVGGYAGTPTKKLYLRWVELGALSPIFQLHGTTPREPWVFDDETVRITKYYFDLRWRLMPDIQKWARDARENGVPMWRPLLYEFPDDKDTWSIEDEFLFGPDLLVAPLLSEDDERPVYLPAGEWVDVWTGERHAGPKRLTARASLAQIPVFARNGAEALFTALPADPRGEVFLELAGKTNDKGLVPAQRYLRGQKYEKIFATVRNHSAEDVSGELTLALPAGFTARPEAKQSFTAPAGGAARVPFYVSWPMDLPVGSYPIEVTGIGEQPLRVTLVKLPGKWQVIGPFDGGVGGEFRGMLPFDLTLEYPGAWGRRPRWQPVADDCVYEDGYIDLAKALGKDSGQTTFAVTTFASPEGGPARFHVGSGDALTIWLNGQQVFDKSQHRSAERDEDAVDVTLRVGENRVFVKISRGIGPNGLYFRVGPRE
jgi:alpha-D-xyloside xylohydrolase